MLKLRIVTAVVLLTILLPLLFYPAPEPFMAFSLVLVSAGVWEWIRLNGGSFRSGVISGVVFGFFLAVLWLTVGLNFRVEVWFVPALVWALGAPLLLKQGVPGWGALARWVRLAVGLLALAFAWVAMAQARQMGVNLLLSIFFLVWAADVFAYFGGKAFGRKKLAPTISPGKSWAGAYTGVLGVFAVALVWCWADRVWAVDTPSLYTRLFDVHPAWGGLALLCLTAMSVVGDLVESLVKRSAGFKDSSNLLPGHGGVLDRIDALLPVLPLAMCLINLF